jgi:hypothetical protein
MTASFAVEQVPIQYTEMHGHKEIKHDPRQGVLGALREDSWAIVYCLYPLFTCIMW